VPEINYSTSGDEVEYPEGTDVNLLRLAIRHNIPLPWKCGSGRCGTDRILVTEGREHLDAPRRRERERLGPLLEEGYRLACQTYACGDVTVSWNPDQKGLDEDSPAFARLKAKWLEASDSA
jgi:ferredoxin